MPETRSLIAAMILLYGSAALLPTVNLKFNSRWLERWALVLLALAFAVNSWVIADRWLESGRPPFKTLFETLVFYPWCVALVTFVLVFLHRLYPLIIFAGVCSALGLVYAILRPDLEIVNLPPALQSGWFVPHVVTYFIAYAALFASFVLATFALLPRETGAGQSGGNGLPSALEFEGYAHQAAVFGICALTLGLVLGAAWGKVAWGDYWGWDPKENWALVCWLAYVTYLHMRLSEGCRGRRAMWALVFAFAAVVFTYLGINLLPGSTDSLHAYQ